ncbi:MAG TPA: hypothetical protein VHJ39_08015 [Solirubrobacteraceae bacterium]|nr:hypothetical protein [Solirubrobacteraceae bacterium]
MKGRPDRYGQLADVHVGPVRDARERGLVEEAPLAAEPVGDRFGAQAPGEPVQLPQGPGAVAPAGRRPRAHSADREAHGIAHHAADRFFERSKNA